MQLLILLVSALSFFRVTLAGAPPDKIYGVNLGSWLLLEPWMLPVEWVAMGGQVCNDCSTCISSESALVAAYPDTADQKFATHWATWFTQDDVTALKNAGINAVRVPLGYWIVEALVDRDTEHYPRGGINFLVKGLKWLLDAGMQVILDHHALPGVQTPGQMFTGNCTNVVQFYTDYNYGRALTWTSVMTFLSHLHPSFKSVFAIEAVNEPIMNATLTPGYGDFQKNFVQVVRATELLLGIEVPEVAALPPYSASSVGGLSGRLTNACGGDDPGIFDTGSPVVNALVEAIPILVELELELGSMDLDACVGRSPLTTNFMDILWQYNNPANPAAAAMGPQAYDHHLYYSFGGVAADNPDAYLTDICNRPVLQDDADVNNTPMWVGEWALSTQFNATGDFLKKWADAQKLAYSQGAGWLFWSFKLEATNPLVTQWSYLKGLELGYLTQDPSQYNDPNVCDPYRNVSSTANNSTASKRGDVTPEPLRRASLRHNRAKRHQLY